VDDGRPRRKTGGRKSTKRGSSNASCRFALQGAIQLPAQTRRSGQARAAGLCALQRYPLVEDLCSTRFGRNICSDMRPQAVPVALRCGSRYPSSAKLDLLNRLPIKNGRVCGGYRNCDYFRVRQRASDAVAKDR
jgi:hypothetical protein